jgi:hypothetical protein
VARSLAAAERWVLHSGSVEHLGLYHLVRARIAKKSGDIRAAQRAVNEGLHLARQAGLWLYQVELLCLQTELLLAGGQSAATLLLGGAPAADAVRSAQEALDLALRPECGFAWGAADAGHLLGQALLAGGRNQDARTALEQALSIRHRIGDHRAEQTEALLESIARRGDSRA